MHAKFDLLTAVQSERNRRTKSNLRSLSLAQFVPLVSPQYEPPVHLGPVLDLFDSIERGPVRACVSVPPRHGKTETTLHGIVRYLARNPSHTVAYVSYAADVSRSKSRLLRDYAKIVGIELRQDAKSLHEWRTPQGGGVLAVGIGGPLTSQGAHLLVVDDPHKNRQEADSPLIRERIWQWFTSTALTRLEPSGSAIIVHTRWHPEDLIGRCARHEEVKWNIVSLPALSRDGRALWPSRWPVHELKSRQRDVGEHDWDSLYQQDPKSKKGRIYPLFNAATHVRKHADLERKYYDPHTGRWLFRRIIIGVDWGFNHPGTMLVVGQTAAGQLVLLHEEVHRERVVAMDNPDGREGWLAIAKRLRDKFHPECFVADPSEPGNILQLRQMLHGRPVVFNANNEVSEGIRRVSLAIALRSDKIPGLLVSDACPHTIQEFENYSWRFLKGTLSEVPQETNDDAMDALRYAVTQFPQ